MDVKECYELWCKRFNLIMKLFMKRAVFNLESCLPKEGTFLLAGKHSSFLDIPVLGASTPKFLRFMARKTLFEKPILGPWMISVGSFPVDLERADRAALQKAIGYLKDGDCVAVFPEGTRKNNPRDIGNLHRGVAYIAMKAGVPIVPVVEVYELGTRFCIIPCIKTVVQYCLPIYPDEMTSKEVTMALLQGRLHEGIKLATKKLDRFK